MSETSEYFKWLGIIPLWTPNSDYVRLCLFVWICRLKSKNYKLYLDNCKSTHQEVFIRLHKLLFKLVLVKWIWWFFYKKTFIFSTCTEPQQLCWLFGKKWLDISSLMYFLMLFLVVFVLCLEEKFHRTSLKTLCFSNLKLDLDTWC